MPQFTATPVTPYLLPAFAAQLQAMRASLLEQLRQQRGGEISRADAAAEARSIV